MLRRTAREPSNVSTACKSILQESAQLVIAKIVEKGTLQDIAERRTSGASGAEYGASMKPRNAQMEAFSNV